MPKRIADNDNGVEIWLVDGEYYVYGILSDPRVLHSEAMARERAAAARTAGHV